MPLTDVQIRSLNGGQKPVKPSKEKSGQPKVSKPKNTTKGAGATSTKTDDEPKFVVTTKPYKVADGAGLYLEVDPSGGKYWRFKYRRTGKEKRISLGVYPEVSLANARKARDGCREQLAKGIDPGVARKAQAAAQSCASSTAIGPL
jgi:hypothetical protein